MVVSWLISPLLVSNSILWCQELGNCSHSVIIMGTWFTIKKSIHTNRNIEGIFPSINFRGILPTEIFSRYIPRELPWKKKIKTKQKKMMTCHFLPTELSTE